MAETASPAATPKRKRDDLTTEMRLSASPTPHHLAKTAFSFQPLILLPIQRSHELMEDGNRSPRSKVAQKFGDLTIEGSREDREDNLQGAITGSEPESGGGAPTAAETPRRIERQKLAPEASRFNFDAGIASAEVDMQVDSDNDDTTAARKRTKIFELDISSPEPASINSPSREATIFTAQTLPLDDRTNNRPPASADPEITSTLEAGRAGHLQKSYLSINRLADSKSRSRKRVSTPPLSSKQKTIAQSVEEEEEEEEEELVIVDPVRAALTWREDEITVYDPEDKDDDGTGINGIGFKPTAAVAYQRAQKRRQQLAEYKKREESEARAKRNQRRRDQLGAGAEMARKHSIVRVHFSDAPPTTVMTT
ncbi:hypothetical protein HD806DRAFT_553053 [Xylariaceae sp. AK1471]|nr:hypothetical protein HD806DRAFT_553053 [Xylariaceae sp. AK1471]